MSFLLNGNKQQTEDGIPYIWGSADTTSTGSYSAQSYTPSSDVQCTLAEVTVESLALALAKQPLDVVRVCGGGARNTWLMQRLTDRLGDTAVTTTKAIGVDPEWVEAWAFAWLAEQTLAGRSGSVPAVTGATGARVLGGIFPA